MEVRYVDESAPPTQLQMCGLREEHSPHVLQSTSHSAVICNGRVRLPERCSMMLLRDPWSIDWSFSEWSRLVAGLTWQELSYCPPSSST